jgi:tetratricopeptide (TPR) repeat protein
MKTNSISKALRDAEQCVALAPSWPKSFSRLGAAQQALGRFDAAIASFEKGMCCVTFIFLLDYWEEIKFKSLLARN